MADMKKINVGPAFNVPLRLASRGTRLASAQLEKFDVATKVSSMKDHPIATKVMNGVNTSYDAVMLALGLVLLFHGAQFKNLFLCYQIITTFCLDRLKESACGIHSHIMTVREKMNADAPTENTSADAKAEPKPDNKHAQKRNSKKDDAKAVTAADLLRQQEEDVATTKKYLKAVDTDQVARVVFDVFTSFMACHMVMRSPLMQTVVITHALVKAAKKYIEALFDFADHEDLLAWMDLLVSFVLYAGIGFVTLTAGRLALAVNLAIVAAELVSSNAFKLAEARGKLESAEAFAASIKGFGVLGGLTAFGSMWQFWALMAGSGLAWYTQILYLPGVIAEFVVGLL